MPRPRRYSRVQFKLDAIEFFRCNGRFYKFSKERSKYMFMRRFTYYKSKDYDLGFESLVNDCKRGRIPTNEQILSLIHPETETYHKRKRGSRDKDVLLGEWLMDRTGVGFYAD